MILWNLRIRSICEGPRPLRNAIGRTADRTSTAKSMREIVAGSMVYPRARVAVSSRVERFCPASCSSRPRSSDTARARSIKRSSPLASFSTRWAMSVSLSLTQGSKRHWTVWNRGLCLLVKVLEDPEHRVAAFRDPVVGLPRPPGDRQHPHEPAPPDRGLDLNVGLVARSARVAVVLEDPVEGHGHRSGLDRIALVELAGRPNYTFLHLRCGRDGRAHLTLGRDHSHLGSHTEAGRLRAGPKAAGRVL